jgi:hypothetical protein
MATKLDLDPQEVQLLRDTLDIDIESWEDELDRICSQPDSSWEEMLQESSFSAEVISTLTRIRNQLT